jgi:hypothetical protein
MSDPVRRGDVKGEPRKFRVYVDLQSQTLRAYQLVGGRLNVGDVVEVVELTPGRTAEAESQCRRCGGPNVSWAAPSPLWNAVMRGGSIDGPWEFGELICPTCFVVLAEERGIACDWTVAAKTVYVALETVTPSGRRWDAESGLWVEPRHIDAKEQGR